ncbi:hypothetical protein ANANG_G00110150 [Anguilla anguilla]|uniref:Cap-specific mRNA (nucleoside-2'-O-)-methyltransferase 2 n=1 Tax=Anguilla anguilla TaxID=7936 RepID=A0A9D3MII0_ANGAN|nr:hypothetical protein ANANG_G00110150 [Anguilla anguilla]
MSRRRGVRKKIFTENRADPIFSTDIESEIQELFNKTTTYSKPASGEWVIPDPNQALRYDPQQHPRLQALKESLNAVKDQLSDKNLEVWHQHTSFTNRAGKIIAHVRAAANAEICTQAWCKFYEILGTFSLVPYGALQSGELNSVHLCEAPGAFIASLNHYLRSNAVHCDWTWAANTLNPYHEANDNGAMIADDRLIANTLPWWFFGSDDTGDLMTQEYLLELQGFTSNMRTVDLVTADGSFDCQANPDEQESLVAPLHYCEAVAALLLLSPGGSFVLKAFTLYEHSSVCLLYLLNCCFRAVHVFKPATSKAGNSEVYVVCLDYCGKDDVKPLLSKMIRNFGPDIAGRGPLPQPPHSRFLPEAARADLLLLPRAPGADHHGEPAAVPGHGRSEEGEAESAEGPRRAGVHGALPGAAPPPERVAVQKFGPGLQRERQAVQQQEAGRDLQREKKAPDSGLDGEGGPGLLQSFSRRARRRGCWEGLPVGGADGRLQHGRLARLSGHRHTQGQKFTLL